MGRPMLITADQLQRVQANGRTGGDHVPLVKLFNPVGSATWLVSEADDSGDMAFGLADLGFGCPELGSFSLNELAALKLPFGLTIERDLYFRTSHPISVWADHARASGSIQAAERLLASRSG